MKRMGILFIHPKLREVRDVFFKIDSPMYCAPSFPISFPVYGSKKELKWKDEENGHINHTS